MKSLWPVVSLALLAACSSNAPVAESTGGPVSNSTAAHGDAESFCGVKTELETLAADVFDGQQDPEAAEAALVRFEALYADQSWAPAEIAAEARANMKSTVDYTRALKAADWDGSKVNAEDFVSAADETAKVQAYADEHC